MMGKNCINPTDHARHIMTYRLGQSDGIQRLIIATHPMMVNELDQPIALRFLRRLWLQYREDRAIECPAYLLSGENLEHRSRFLQLLATAVEMAGDLEHLRAALRQTIAALPQHERTITQSNANFDDDVDLLYDVQMHINAVDPSGTALPDDTALKLLRSFLYTTTHDEDLKTSNSPCWALNLMYALNSKRLGLSIEPIPMVGIFRRHMFKPEETDTSRRYALLRTIAQAAETAIVEILDLNTGLTEFYEEFPALRSNSRLNEVFLLLTGLGELSTTQVARVLDMSQPGARKLLMRLEQHHLSHQASNNLTWTSQIRFKLGQPRHPWLDHDSFKWIESHSDDKSLALMAHDTSELPRA